jgi:hypothetical protein
MRDKATSPSGIGQCGGVVWNWSLVLDEMAEHRQGGERPVTGDEVL